MASRTPFTTTNLSENLWPTTNRGHNSTAAQRHRHAPPLKRTTGGSRSHTQDIFQVSMQLCTGTQRSRVRTCCTGNARRVKGPRTVSNPAQWLFCSPAQARMHAAPLTTQRPHATPSYSPGQKKQPQPLSATPLWTTAGGQARFGFSLPSTIHAIVRSTALPTHNTHLCMRASRQHAKGCAALPAALLLAPTHTLQARPRLAATGLLPHTPGTPNTQARTTCRCRRDDKPTVTTSSRLV